MKFIRRFGGLYKNFYVRLHTFNAKGFVFSLQENRSNIVRIIWRACVFGCVVFTFQRYVACLWVLEGNSNEPTFMDGEIVLVI